MITVGVDVGSLTTKAVAYDSEKKEKIIGKYISPSGHQFERAGIDVFSKVLEIANLEKNDVDYILSTGYGRYSLDFVHDKVTEITAHAKGVTYFYPEAQTIIDIGGQDSKAIKVQNGVVKDFMMNDKCAAGTGRFIEVMAEALSVESLDLMGELSLKSKNPAKISSMCTVFAESEVISLFAEKKHTKIDIIAGIHNSIAKRVGGLVRRLGKVKDAVVFVGGVAKNVGVKKALENELNAKIYTPKGDYPQLTGALGASIIANEKYSKKRMK
ncbi:MAG: 2-hydroxyglutaryl-CoA dehydratase [Promethearchaeota archaeon]|nr:MAG: 2-hydroxyglutaryl-CoA dehydratase [Candidatus Lokiarchaeota archaeon]